MLTNDSLLAVILDDHGLFATSFSLLLEKYRLFHFVKSFDSKDDFLRFLESSGTQKIYIFLDYYLSEETGLSLLPEISRLNKDAKTIFLTSALSPLLIQTLKNYNPDGILSKSCNLDTLKSCLASIRSGQHFIDPFFEKLLENHQSIPVRFTPREIELLQHFALGESIAKTAEKLFLSPHTVVAHRRKMMAKINCQSITQLITFAREHEVI